MYATNIPGISNLWTYHLPTFASSMFFQKWQSWIVLSNEPHSLSPWNMCSLNVTQLRSWMWLVCLCVSSKCWWMQNTTGEDTWLSRHCRHNSLERSTLGRHTGKRIAKKNWLKGALKMILYRIISSSAILLPWQLAGTGGVRSHPSSHSSSDCLFLMQKMGFIVQRTKETFWKSLLSLQVSCKWLCWKDAGRKGGNGSSWGGFEMILLSSLCLEGCSRIRTAFSSEWCK